MGADDEGADGVEKLLVHLLRSLANFAASMLPIG